MSKCLVVVPTYNEVENIDRLLKAVFSLPQEFHVLVVDDNSPDGTADVVKRKMVGNSDRLLSSNAAANWVSERLISRVLNGDWPLSMTIFLRWTLTFRTIRMI